MLLGSNWRFLPAWAISLLLVSAAFAQEAPVAPAARLAKLKAEYDADFKTANKPITDPMTGQILRYETTGRVSPDKYLPLLIELGHSTDEATAVTALADAVCTWSADKRSEEALDLLLKRFGDSPRLIDFARAEYSRIYPGQEKHLARLVAEAKDPASICMSLVKLGMLHDDNFVPYAFRKLTAKEGEQERAKALEYYRRVVADFPQQDEGRGAGIARRCITQLQRLRIGLPAPATAALDVTGRQMTLTEWRGKVVVVDFWGSWCGPCLRKLPIMKELAAKYGAKDVVFLGVMAEVKAEDAAKAIEKHKITWRNWLDLRDGKGDSPIVKDWGVVGFPSVFVLDRTGTIRFTHILERDEIERALDTLLAEKPPARSP